jgi:hypothetical protein
MECVLCVGLVTCSHATVMTHLYVFKKERKVGRHTACVRTPLIEN